MHFSLVSFAAVAGLVGFSAAHMQMVEPPAWKVENPASPLADDGSNFPCGGATPDQEPTRTYKAGGQGMLKVMGSAAHGGGSGQMVITYDFPPTAGSKWRVLQSWEGDHPCKVDGNFSPPDPNRPHAPIAFNITSTLPAGKAVIAWSWFNRIGNREHYMKCATVQIEGSDTALSTSLENLPTMFRANSGNGCTVPENVDAINFKNPGESLVVASGYTPTSIDCDPSIAGIGGFSNNTPPDETKKYGSVNTLQNTNITLPTTKPAHKPDYTEGDFKLYSSLEDDSVDTMKTTDDKPSEDYAPVEPSATCEEGTVTCNPDNTWSICGSGRTQLIGRVPPGSVCENHLIIAAHAKRSIRFSHAHMRRSHKLRF